VQQAEKSQKAPLENCTLLFDFPRLQTIYFIKPHIPLRDFFHEVRRQMAAWSSVGARPFSLIHSFC
jgi:hypothetical protein